jgi:hypothetical protein
MLRGILSGTEDSKVKTKKPLAEVGLKLSVMSSPTTLPGPKGGLGAGIPPTNVKSEIGPVAVLKSSVIDVGAGERPVQSNDVVTMAPASLGVVNAKLASSPAAKDRKNDPRFIENSLKVKSSINVVTSTHVNSSLRKLPGSDQERGANTHTTTRGQTIALINLPRGAKSAWHQSPASANPGSTVSVGVFPLESEGCNVVRPLVGQTNEHSASSFIINDVHI